jgi:thiamine pyrophosphate-dependent acetolactate synthase large subunit-like protein
MGTAISIATGIGIAKPEIPQICFLGEGSFSASYHDIASIINLKLPICIMVFSDDSMHSVTRTNKKLIDTGNFLPINFKTLEKSLIFDSPIHYIFSLEELSNIFQSWQKTKPLILILKFENKNYARLVECLR